MLTYNDREVQVEGRIIDRKIWKSIWSCKAAQRIKLFAWKCIRGLHSTKYKRALFNSDLETNCDICGHNEETIEHIILECRHARTVWRGININIDAVRASHNSVSEWVTSWFSHQNRNKEERWLYSLMIGAWIIWKDRCDIVFQGVSLNPCNTVHMMHYHLTLHLQESHSAVLSNVIASRWKPPLDNIFKYNIDGSFDHDTNQFGIGIVLRDSTGRCIGAKRNYGNGALSLEAVDHSLVIQWENRNLVKEIKYLSSTFSLCTFDYVSRDDNQVANSLAKSAKETKISAECFKDFDSIICSLLA
ncbi:uncharacterized protein LOC113356547 [Papaver somniferum]|uniref:uncharacterized protein LOC113356547 n=1 Tax=Papaver somniferum TaxID=3469 RepID=UPI000E6F825E|nr:uncharacterized protein LOC113356547 [Papaver somniferum]